jgi:hypothetical protein
MTRPKTGGRQKGTPNRATAARAAEIAASGLTPLQFMLQVLRDTKRTHAERYKAAVDAAPYVHPKFASVAHTDPEGNALPTVMEIRFVDAAG